MCGECEMLNDACWLGKIIPRKIFKRTLRTIYLCSLWIRAFIAFARRQSWSLLDSLRKCMPPMAHAGIVLFCYPSEFSFRNCLSLLQSWQGYCPQLMLLFIQSGSCGLSGGWMVCYPVCPRTVSLQKICRIILSTSASPSFVFAGFTATSNSQWPYAHCVGNAQRSSRGSVHRLCAARRFDTLAPLWQCSTCRAKSKGQIISVPLRLGSIGTMHCHEGREVPRRLVKW